ncbi:MAG: hypothetical protein WBO10_11690 [Pyrinomonadaceae bacterium]
MEFIIGIALGLVIGLSMSLVGMDRDRALYPAMMIVIALLYILFAVMGGSTQALLIESTVAAIFIGLAIAGFRSTLWLVAAALIGHGIFDVLHSRLFDNPGVPVWWPPFCLAADIALGAYLGWLLISSRVRTAPY